MKINRLLKISEIENGTLGDEPGVVVVNTVVGKNKTGKDTVLVMNTTNRMIKLRRESIIGKSGKIQNVNVVERWGVER